MKSARPGRGSDQFPLRLPDGMRERLKAEAEKNSRSMNAEIVDRLEQALADAGPSKSELGEIIDRQNQYMQDQQSTIKTLMETAQFQKQTIEDMSRQARSEGDLAIGILRHVLGYIDKIPPSLTVWADQTLRILDENSDWSENAEDEDVILRPSAPEHRQKFEQMVRDARQRHDAYMNEIMARIRERSKRAPK